MLCGTGLPARLGRRTGSQSVMAILQVRTRELQANRTDHRYAQTAMTPGGTSQEITQLNIESLWSGGPFQDSVSMILHFVEAELIAGRA